VESWAVGIGCLRRGGAVTRPWVCVHLRILALFAAPALVAAYLAASTVGRKPELWEQAALAVLPWVTAVVGTVVVMVAVSAQAHGQRTGVLVASLKALPWVPRYFWTNVHTTVIFWVPVGALLQARALQEHMAPVDVALQPVVGGLWWTVTGLVGLFLHARTLLAAFLAVHGDLPGTMAALEAWRLSARHLGQCLGTLIAGVVPVGLPLAVLAGIAMVTLTGRWQAVFWAAAPNLVWAGIQAVRPVLIPAAYVLYRQVWETELQRRARDGQLPTPAAARVLLRITRPLPHPGRLSPLSGS
jgi:hypothetical protein